MFVLNPDPFLLPSFRISPFQTADLAFNNQLPDDDFAVEYCNNQFGKDHWQQTYNGREAIHLALQHYNLKKEDVVTILTTSENFYISSCVTHTISQFCKWNREITAETKIILVNHEFGFPHPKMETLVNTGLPIIEDCCTTFFSNDKNGKVGKYGDYAVYSFPKFFPLQIGGLLVSNKVENESGSILKSEESLYIRNVLSFHLKNRDTLLEKRNENYRHALSLSKQLGFSERFENNENIVASASLLKNNGIVKDLHQLKVFLTERGIQNSVFYGEDAFFIPSHQNLSFSDCDYFFNCIAEFLKIQ